MTEFVAFQFERDTHSEWALPSIGKPIPADLISKVTHDSCATPLEKALFHLQLASARPGADLPRLESAIHRLLEQLSTRSSQPSVEAGADAWRLEIGPVPLDQELITINRGGYLLCVLRPDEEGRLIATSFRPLDAHTLQLLTRLSARPHPRHGVAMRPNNWEYALDSTVTADNFYASNQDLPYLTHFDSGIWDTDLVAHPAAYTAIQLDIFSKLDGTSLTLWGALQEAEQIALTAMLKTPASGTDPLATAARHANSGPANETPADSGNGAPSNWWKYR
jgi:hypothetical protein